MKYKMIHYTSDGQTITYFRCKRIDIVNSHSLFYYDCSDHKIYRIFSDVNNVNLEAGIITVYYINGSYVVITKVND